MIGASFDTPAENKAFRDAQGFEYPLLSDVDRAVGTAYEVTRAADDKYANFPNRVSYLIDPSGNVAHVYEVADVAGHAAEVLATLTTLRG